LLSPVASREEYQAATVISSVGLAQHSETSSLQTQSGAGVPMTQFESLFSAKEVQITPRIYTSKFFKLTTSIKNIFSNYLYCICVKRMESDNKDISPSFKLLRVVTILTSEV